MEEIGRTRLSNGNFRDQIRRRRRKALTASGAQKPFIYGSKLARRSMAPAKCGGFQTRTYI